jgi:hypothetical protein
MTTATEALPLVGHPLAARPTRIMRIGLLRTVGVTGDSGLQAAQQHRTAAIAAAQEFGDPGLTVRRSGAYDVPAIWTCGDDPNAADVLPLAVHRLAVCSLGRSSSSRYKQLTARCRRITACGRAVGRSLCPAGRIEVEPS